jgi:hypothetical protein
MIRYVDDIFGVVAFDPSSLFSKRFAQFILYYIQHHTYHKNMRIIETPSDGWFPFLEALLRISPTGDLDIRYNTKNADSILASSRLSSLTIQHRDSFMPARDAIKRVYGALHRLRAVVDTPFWRMIGVMELFATWSAQGYTTSIFSAALRLMHNKLSEPFWSACTSLIRILVAGTPLEPTNS